ncbi:palmitoyl-protein thioesterase 1-like [Cydia pomonella]|uniref:palmitoyl-protein thioesterase 1-like n=1 Tax=Cydia pomonella TaxID=82600 RepID=UPI002ADE5619|nr:palmitoyl-protein thioesterase 1-like [Cydia pomonella]
MKFLVSLLFIIQIAVAVKYRTVLPIVLWHGMGDVCCLPISTGILRLFLFKHIPDVYILSMETSDNSIIALEDSYFLNPNKQVDYACMVLRADKHLKNGFNVIGLGQGSLFLRAVIQRCGHKLPPIKNYISFGGPQQGIYGLPQCIALSHQTCSSMQELLELAAYHSMTQNAIIPATYWHDPLRDDEYKKKSIFLADINNEQVINELYRWNLKKLQHFVMVKFENDSVVQPRESEWFGYYTPGQMQEMQTLRQSKIYLEDRLGLQEMDRAGKLVFLLHPNEHLQLDSAWMFEHIMPYLVDKQFNQATDYVSINI